MKDIPLLFLIALAPAVTDVAVDGAGVGMIEGVSASGALLAVGWMIVRKLDEQNRTLRKLTKGLRRVNDHLGIEHEEDEDDE